MLPICTDHENTVRTIPEEAENVYDGMHAFRRINQRETVDYHVEKKTHLLTVNCVSGVRKAIWQRRMQATAHTYEIDYRNVFLTIDYFNKCKCNVQEIIYIKRLQLLFSADIRIKSLMSLTIRQ